MLILAVISTYISFGHKLRILRKYILLTYQVRTVSINLGFPGQMSTIINQMFLGNSDIYSQIKCPMKKTRSW